MKKYLLFSFLFWGALLFNIYGQKEISISKENFLETRKIADSLNIEYPEVITYLGKIDVILDFKDRLLINNNYKNPSVRISIFNDYKNQLPIVKDYDKIISREENIIDFAVFEENKIYNNARRQILKKIRTFLENNISNLEKELIIILRKGNYKIEQFNKLTEVEKEEVLKKIEKGYIYP